MNKSIKKLLSIPLTLTLLMATLAGCGSSSSTVKNADSATGEQVKLTDGALAKYAPVAGKKYKIEWTGYNLAPLNENAEMVKYWNDKLNIDLKVWNIDSSKYEELLNLRMASGEYPDAIRVVSIASLQKYYEQDILTELPMDVFKKYAPNLNKMYEKENPDALKYGALDGKFYALPGYRNHAEFRNPVVWRGDWLKNVGIEKTPDTLDEFEKALYKFANNDPDKNGKKDTFGLSNTALDMIYGAFGSLPNQWKSKDGKMFYGAIQPEMKEALKTLAKWYKDGVIDPEFLTGENKGGYFAISNAFVSNRIGLSGIGNYYHWNPAFENESTGQMFDELKKANPTALNSLVNGQPPLGTTGKRSVTQEGLIDGSFYAFSKNLEKEPDKLGKILEFIDSTQSSFESFTTTMMGMEGKHWQTKAGLPVRNDKYMDWKELSKIGGHTVLLAGPNSYDYWGKLFPQRTKWARDQKINLNGSRNELLAPLSSNGKYKTELDKIQLEAYTSIITGDKPIEFFDEFVKNWKAAGGDQLTKEANEWFTKINKK